MRKAAAENRLTMNVLHIMEEIPVGKERNKDLISIDSMQGLDVRVYAVAQ